MISLQTYKGGTVLENHRRQNGISIKAQLFIQGKLHDNGKYRHRDKTERRMNLPLLAIVLGFCAALLYDLSLFDVMFAVIADAYLQVSTLLPVPCYYFLWPSGRLSLI